MNQNQEAVEFIKQAIEAFDALATLEAILESKDVSMDAFQKITDSLKHLPFSKIRGAIMLAHANDIVASMEKANDGVDSLYVASCEHVPGRYKIGRTTQDPHRRVAQFRTGAPDAKLVLHYQGLGSLERKVHKLLKECRVGRSEWFSCSIDNVHDAVSLAFDGDVDAVRIDAKQD